MKILTLDIELHKKDGWSQAKYLVHCYSDVLWTDSLEEAFDALKEGFAEFEKRYEKEMEEK